MDDDDKKSEDEAAEPAPDAAQDEGAKLREVSEEKLRRILDAHKTSCETGGKEGEKADQFAANVLPVIRDIERAGVTTLQGIAEALNARGIRTARGRRWYASTVRNLLVRADQVEGVKDAA